MVLALGCSDLTEGSGGVVELEVGVPAISTTEVGGTIQLTARPLDKDGNLVNTPVTWITTGGAVISVDNTGTVLGMEPGAAEAQAFAGSLSSSRIPITVITRADTVMLVGDSVVTIPAGVSTSAPVSVQVRSVPQDAPLTNRPVVFTLTYPPTVGHIPVQLPGGVLVDTVSTGTEAVPAASITVSRVAGVESPDTAFLLVRSYRPNGVDDVPGTGQRFIVLFQ
jgi:Bacterial Ig-like domain (group 2)